MRTLLFFTITMAVSYAALADVRLPKIFGDNMVLQRDRPIMIWGWANVKEKVSIQFNKQSRSAITGKDGKWKVTLSPEVYGGPYQLVVKGKNSITFSNVLVGDVWICSGQSNMEWPVRLSNNATEEIRKSDIPVIRHFKVPTETAARPMDDLTGGEWKISSPETSGDFTAVGYFFAREINHELNIPIGLINASWGGTHVETWTSRDAFENSDEFRSMIAAMPNLNLDSIAKANLEGARKRIQNLQGQLPGPHDPVHSWKEISFDDSAWPTMKVPGYWENQPVGNIDGIIWFRKTFHLSAEETGKEAVLEIAKIDDNDETYVNGVKVGGINRYSDSRQYTIPGGVLKQGKNVIAVRIEDTGAGGGIYGDASTVRITILDKVYPLAGLWPFRVEKLVIESGLDPNDYPTLLFNAMINPLIPYGIQGVLWYQGEANVGRSYQYRKAFPLMITDWRNHWKQGDFPFYYVQLASFNDNGGNSKRGSEWAELREAQTLALSVPNTGMAVTTDIGDPKDIHPRNKQDVGKRLAAIALSKTYGKNRIHSGPIYRSMSVEGNRAIVTFTNTAKGLTANDKYGYLKGFEIAGADQKFHYAKAFIDGDHVVVYADSVQTPAAVRFGWADDASDNNLFNIEGLPALPFRTDNWKGITEERKFGF